MSKISFVVPCYNSQAYIAESVGSLQKQTLKDIEIIVVNDGSTDSSREILEYLKKQDKRIRVYDLPRNRGRSYARNYGNKKAKSDIIAVLDADDISSENRAMAIYKHFKKNPETDVFYSSFVTMDKHNSITGNIKAVGFDIEITRRNLMTYIGHSTMAYRKKVLKKIEYSYGKWSDLGCDDWKFQMDAYKHGFKFGFYNQMPLVIYRQLDNTISAKRDPEKVKEIKCQYLKSL